MKIYTKTGDDGETGLFGGARVSKDDARVEAYGDVDELNSVLGVLRTHIDPAHSIDKLLATIQSQLFDLGAELATTEGKETSAAQLALADVERLERAIDANEEGLAPLKNFVLPGGCPAAAAAHGARTVCRRAERRLVTLKRTATVRAELIHYLNRLSDLLFVLARALNHQAGVPDVPWVGRS